MPRYHIHVCTSAEMVPDRKGRSLLDRAHALRLAVRYARLLKAKKSYAHIDVKVLVIQDAEGRLVATVPFNSKPIQVPVSPAVPEFSVVAGKEMRRRGRNADHRTSILKPERLRYEERK